MEAVSVEDVALTHGTARHPHPRPPRRAQPARPRDRDPLAFAHGGSRRRLGGAGGDRHRRGPGVLRRRRPAGYMDMYEHEREFRAFLDEFRALNAAWSTGGS